MGRECNVAKKAYIVWPKLKEVVDFRKSLPKSKQPSPCRGKVGENRNFDTLLVKKNKPLIPFKTSCF